VKRDRRVNGLLHSNLSSSSLLKKSGNAPKRLFKNSSAETGTPSAVQNDVEIMCLISSSFPFLSLTLTFFLQIHGLCPHTKHSGFGSFIQIQGCCLHTQHSFFSPPFIHWHLSSPQVMQTSGSSGSPSHSGSAKW